MRRSRKFSAPAGPITRRCFAVQAGLGIAGLSLSLGKTSSQEKIPSAVALGRHQDRRRALEMAAGLLGKIDFGGRGLFIKGNYNSADPFPATTHPEMLALAVEWLRAAHCGQLTLVERSGMGDTKDVWAKLEVPDLARRLGIRLLALEDIPAEQWRREELPGSSWKSGIEVPAFLDRDAYVVQICNLKTHRFGAGFSASLKNSIGLMAKYGQGKDGYNYMAELHASPQQGAMIAEANQVYEPKLLLMDAMQIFTAGGPDTGETSPAQVVMASADRVALDAAGVALLRLMSERDADLLFRRPVFDQDQIKRAAELDLGAHNANEISFLTPDAHSSMLASQLEAILQAVDPKSKK